LTEIPALLRLIEDYSDRSGFDVVMIAVDDDAEKVETFVGGRAAMMLYDDWNVAHRYGTRKLPETYLVVDGTVLEKWEGAQNWDDAEIRARLDAALGGDGAPEVARLTGAAGGSER
jgi:hypothetical protein